MERDSCKVCLVFLGFTVVSPIGIDIHRLLVARESPCQTKPTVHIPNGEDVVVPWRESNHVAVDLITQHIRSKLGAWLWLVMAFGE